jgi:hypothetical protein
VRPWKTKVSDMLMVCQGRMQFGRLIVAGLVSAAVATVARSTLAAEPSFMFHFAGDAVKDMQFAPDGRKLVLVTFETKRRGLGGAQFTARVYDVRSGTMERKIQTGAWLSAWSHDGSVVALPRGNAIDIDVFDARTWKTRQTLHITYPKDCPPAEISRLCFDRGDNLYVAEFNSWLDGGMKTKKEFSPRVWWKAGDHWSSEAKLFGTCCTAYSDDDSRLPLMAFDLSVAAGAQDPRLAVSYWVCRSQILDVRSRKGVPSVALVSTFGVGQRFLKLTPDGNRLVTYQFATMRVAPGGGETHAPSELSVFQVGGDHVELLTSRTVQPPRPREMGVPQVLDASNNGQLAAYCARRVVGVVRVPSCDPVLLIPHKEDGVTAIAFTPDNRLLAVADEEKKDVLFYRIQK